MRAKAFLIALGGAIVLGLVLPLAKLPCVYMGPWCWFGCCL